MMLSDIYQISINEILAGERVSPEEFKEKADENIKDIVVMVMVCALAFICNTLNIVALGIKNEGSGK